MLTPLPFALCLNRCVRQLCCQLPVRSTSDDGDDGLAATRLLQVSLVVFRRSRSETERQS